ncbi:hypothetical protein [Nocardia asiatica]
MSTQLPSGAQPSSRSKDGPDMPRVEAIIAQMTAQFGPDYTMTFARAIEAASNDNDQARYHRELDAAVDILVHAGWTREQSKTIAIGHVSSVHAAIGEDLQAHVNAGGTLPDRRRPTGNEST